MTDAEILCSACGHPKRNHFEDEGCKVGISVGGDFGRRIVRCNCDVESDQ